MNERETAATLDALRSLHRSAADAAMSAMEVVGERGPSAELRSMADDHRRFSEELSRIAPGGGPGKASEALADLEREHGRLIRDARGQDEALEALLLLEQTLAAQHELASAMELPGDVADALRGEFEAERRHVSSLKERVGQMPVEVAGGGVTTEHLFVDDKNPDDFDNTGGV